MLEEMLRGGSRGIVGFDPTTIPGCTVWFDAADPATFGLSGTSLQSWRSKGSAMCTATYSGTAPTVSTISGLSTIYFNGTSSKMLTNSIASYGATETTWITCAVNLATVSASAPPDASVVIGTQGTGAERAIRYTCNVNATAYSINTSVLRQTTGDNTNGVRGFIDTAAYFAGFTNGSLITSNTTAVTFQSGVNQSFVMGQWNVGWLNGYVYEILIYNRALSLGEYQSVEGYLAQKWGFSPAKVFTPTSIPGCQLWLDGADTTTMSPGAVSGGQITGWKDKSSNAVSYISGTIPNYSPSNLMPPTYVAGGGVNFNPSYPAGGGYINGTTQGLVAVGGFSLNLTGFTTFVVAKATGTMTSYNSYFSWSSASVTQFLDFDSFGGAPGGIIADSGALNTVAAGTNLSTITQMQMLQGTTTGATFYVNGALSNTTSYSYTQTTFPVAINVWIGNQAPGNRSFSGTIYELLIYNAALTATQRQAVEGYLAWKWNLQGSLGATHPNYLTTGNFVKSLTLATTHPYYSLQPATRAFAPIDIPGCQLWLDGADSSAASMTVSSTTISVWKDKSQNAYSFAGTAVLSTISGFSAPWFNYANTNPLTYLTCTTLSIPQPYTVFAVGYSALNGGNTRMVNGLVGGTYDTSLFIGSFGSNATVFTGNGSSWNSANGSLYGIDLNVWSITAAVISNANVNGYFNGTTITPVTGSYTPATLTGLNVGGGYGTLTNLANTNYQPWSGSIGEILFYSGVLTTAQRQAVEGYLANKWGLKASMPAFVNPRSIPGCALWFDGNDPAGTGVAPANGASVSAWVNKGTTAVTMAYGTSQPTFSSNFQNGFGSVAFNGNYFSGACSFNLAAKSGFLVCSQSNSATDSPQGFLSFYGSGADTVGSTNGYGYQATQGGYGSFGWLYNIFQSGVGAASPSTGYYINTGTAGANTPLAIYGNVMSNLYEQAFVNGTNNSNFTSTTTPGTSTTLMLGARLIGGSLRGSLYGNICEVIVYNVGLSIAQRQTVEGYLAWKWGLQAQLPATHPFYAAAPLPHSFNKVPPTIRQPALYYDVAPGNWVRDWQPYLKQLAAANSTGVTVTMSTFGTVSTSQIWNGGVLAPNGCIYCIPQGASSILVINTLNDTVSTIGTVATNQYWLGGALAPNGNIYFIPYVASNVLMINPTTNTISYFGSITNNGRVGGVLAPNGNIYCTPITSDGVLVINTSTNTVSTFGSGLTGTWNGSVLGPNGYIYGIPYGSTSTITVTNTNTNTVTTIGSVNTALTWRFGCLAQNGNIYGIPMWASTASQSILLINPSTNTVTTFGTVSQAYNGGVLGPDGNIYCAPYSATNILVINPTTNALTYVGSGLSTSWIGGILAPNGNIYFIPYSSASIIKLTFTGLSQRPSLAYCLSAWANHL